MLFVRNGHSTQLWESSGCKMVLRSSYLRSGTLRLCMYRQRRWTHSHINFLGGFRNTLRGELPRDHQFWWANLVDHKYLLRSQDLEPSFVAWRYTYSLGDGVQRLGTELRGIHFLTYKRQEELNNQTRPISHFIKLLLERERILEKASWNCATDNPFYSIALQHFRLYHLVRRLPHVEGATVDQKHIYTWSAISECEL